MMVTLATVLLAIATFDLVNASQYDEQGRRSSTRQRNMFKSPMVPGNRNGFGGSGMAVPDYYNCPAIRHREAMRKQQRVVANASQAFQAYLQQNPGALMQQG